MGLFPWRPRCQPSNLAHRPRPNSRGRAAWADDLSCATVALTGVDVRLPNCMLQHGLADVGKSTKSLGSGPRALGGPSRSPECLQLASCRTGASGNGRKEPERTRLAKPSGANAESVMKMCGEQWQAAKAAGTTNGETWPQFLSQCRAQQNSAGMAGGNGACTGRPSSHRRAGSCGRKDREPVQRGVRGQQGPD